MTNRNVQSTVATSNHTTNYDLPLWSGQDITTWQGNLNDAFNKIDTAMYENKTLMLGYKEIADKLEETNDSTVDLVNQVNAQLSEINANYQEVKDGLAAANQKITEAEQAIINLQNEDESVKVQMDTMQDDIGKMMEYHTGITFDVSEVAGESHPMTGYKGGTFICTKATLVSSIVTLTFKYTPPNSNIVQDSVSVDNEVLSNIRNLFGFINPKYSDIIGYGGTTEDGLLLTTFGTGRPSVQAFPGQHVIEGVYSFKALVSQEMG